MYYYYYFAFTVDGRYVFLEKKDESPLVIDITQRAYSLYAYNSNSNVWFKTEPEMPDSKWKIIGSPPPEIQALLLLVL